MLRAIIRAVIIAAVVWLACVFLGTVLFPATGVPVAVAVGGFIATWAVAIGILAGAWDFFSGGTWNIRRPPA